MRAEPVQVASFGAAIREHPALQIVAPVEYRSPRDNGTTIIAIFAKK
jgi:hypothetical protein